jgi:hypothetical protein
MFTLSDDLIRVPSQRAVVVAELDVNQGRVCVGQFVEAPGGCQRIALRVPASDLSGVVFRNASPGGASHFRMLRLGLALEVSRP